MSQAEIGGQLCEVISLLLLLLGFWRWKQVARLAQAPLPTRPSH